MKNYWLQLWQFLATVCESLTVWAGEMENNEGMISIESTTNEPMEIMFPKSRFSRRVTTKKR